MNKNQDNRELEELLSGAFDRYADAAGDTEATGSHLRVRGQQVRTRRRVMGAGAGIVAATALVGTALVVTQGLGDGNALAPADTGSTTARITGDPVTQQSPAPSTTPTSLTLSTMPPPSTAYTTGPFATSEDPAPTTTTDPAAPTKPPASDPDLMNPSVWPQSIPAIFLNFNTGRESLVMDAVYPAKGRFSFAVTDYAQGRSLIVGEGHADEGEGTSVSSRVWVTNPTGGLTKVYEGPMLSPSARFAPDGDVVILTGSAEAPKLEVWSLAASSAAKQIIEVPALGSLRAGSHSIVDQTDNYVLVESSSGGWSHNRLTWVARGTGDVVPVPEGQIVKSRRIDDQILVIDSSGKEKGSLLATTVGGRAEERVIAEDVAGLLSVSPDGRYALVPTAQMGGGLPMSRIDLETGESTPILEAQQVDGPRSFLWASDRVWLYPIAAGSGLTTCDIETLTCVRRVEPTMEGMMDGELP